MTMKRLLATLALTVGTAALAAPAAAADQPRLLTPEMVAGQEIRGNMPGQIAVNEDYVWRFLPGGTVTGAMTGTVFGTRHGGWFVQENDVGQWTVVDGRLCIVWNRWWRGAETCYSMVPQDRNWTRFEAVGYGPSFRGTFDHR